VRASPSRLMATRGAAGCEDGIHTSGSNSAMLMTSKGAGRASVSLSVSGRIRADPASRSRARRSTTCSAAGAENPRSHPPALIDAVLDGAGLRQYFRAALSTEQVQRGKPAPDIYLAVTDRLGFPPEACAAVEDSTNGLRSAAAAGLQVIAVPHPRYPPEPAALHAARLVLTGLDELTAQAIAEL
jgi:haloacid dehalogenase-like hydrolase